MKKGDILTNKNDVKIKIIQIKKDEFFTDTMVRVEFLNGLNAGRKSWYEMNKLESLFTIKVIK